MDEADFCEGFELGKYCLSLFQRCMRDDGANARIDLRLFGHPLRLVERLGGIYVAFQENHRIHAVRAGRLVVIFEQKRSLDRLDGREPRVPEPHGIPEMDMTVDDWKRWHPTSLLLRATPTHRRAAV